jgi:UDP-N-acetylglucosamine transferase subunit ALG13
VIFATTGTQLPFPRLIAALDALAPRLGEPVVAQIGPDRAAYAHIESTATLAAAAFEARFAAARLVVAHAGIGSILSARRHGKPIVIVPRRHDLGEHRNDHQLATARELQDRAGVHVAWDTGDLEGLLLRPDLAGPGDAPAPRLGELVDFVAGFVSGRV